MYVFARHLQEDYRQKVCKNLQYPVRIVILIIRIVLFFIALLMVDPFASTNPTDPKEQSNTNTDPSHDVFGGVPNIFSDMAATAFQPIDPETGRPTEHTPETLDPFLRDDLSDSSISDMEGSDSSNDISPIQSPEETLSQEPFVDAFGIVSEKSPEESNTIEETSETVQPIEQENKAEEEMPETQTFENEIPEEETPAIKQPTDQISIPNQDEDVVDTQTPSYFETTVSFDDAPVASELDATKKFTPSSVENLESSANVSDHYDPFVDAPSDQSQSAVSDDPFLQDAVVDEKTVDSDTEVKDPFLEDYSSASTDEVSSQDIQEEFSPVPEKSIIDSSNDQPYSVTEESGEDAPINESIVTDQQNDGEEKISLDITDTVS